MVEIPSANLLAVFEGWSALVLAVVGLFSLPTVAGTLIFQRRDAKRERTFEYLKRLYDLEFAELNTRVLLFLQTGDKKVFWPAFTLSAKLPADDNGKRAAFEALELRYRNKVTLVLNFYEEFSGSYRKGLLDRGVADEMILPIAVEVWKQSNWFIAYERENSLNRYGDKGKAENILSEWQCLMAEHAEGSHPGPAWDRLRGLGRHLDALAIPLAGAFAILGLLVVALAADSFRDVAASLLFAAASVCFILGAGTLAQRLSSLPTARVLITSAAVVVSLSIGVTTTLALKASVGPPGPKGTTGSTGKMGEEGQEGPRGAKGGRGKQGERGLRGHGGPRGRRGPRGRTGHRGPRGPRGFPGDLGS
ncbi:MAG TPA: hypothetical protein VMH33_01295 [Solirubrobacterales bacterium]|nr:hypothetical protein [Solirubrobacterales bacterium]